MIAGLGCLFRSKHCLVCLVLFGCLLLVSAAAIAKSLSSDELRTVLEQGQQAYERYEYQAALELLLPGEKQAKESGNIDLHKEFLIAVSDLYLKVGPFNDAVPYLKELADMYTSEQDTQGQAQAHLNIGIALVKAEDYDSSLWYLSEANNVYFKKDALNEAKSYLELSKAVNGKKQYDDALLLSEKAFHLYHEAGDDFGCGEALLAAARVFIDRHPLFTREGPPKEIFVLIEDAIDYYKEAGSDKGVADAILLRERNTPPVDPARMVKEVLYAIKIHNGSGYRVEVADEYSLLGNLHFIDIKDYSTALSCFNESIGRYYASGMVDEASLDYMIVGEICKKPSLSDLDKICCTELEKKYAHVQSYLHSK